jgi:S1/P1 Nuclease
MKALRVLSILLLTIASHRAYAWGDDGHKAIALIAQNYLEPAVKTRIDAMLKADPDNLTPHDLPSEATWADKYRDSNNRRDHYQQTQNWHFVDLEINDPDIAVAASWTTGTPEDWAREAFAMAQEDVYGDPPLSTGRAQHVDAAYVDQAKTDVALQLSRAGVRLAHVLNEALK